MLACIPLILVHSHSSLNIHASHIANVCLLSISVNAVLSVFHNLFTHLTHWGHQYLIGVEAMFSHGFRMDMTCMHNTQCVNAYFSALSAAVTAREASLESNLESSDGTNIMYNLYFWRKQPFVCFVKVKLNQNISRSDLQTDETEQSLFPSDILFLICLALLAFDLMLLLSVNRSV